MLIAAPLIQAALIFFTSATAVTVFGVRVSDIAALLFFISLFFVRSNCNQRKIATTSLLCLLLLLTFISLVFQLLEFDPGLVPAGLPNAIAIPFGLILSLIFLNKCSEQRAVAIASAYCRIALLACWALFLWQWVFGRPEWIQVGEVESRFSAFSNNPNQLALFLLPIPFFSVFCFMKGARSGRGVIVDIAAAVLLNLFIIGKGLLVSWAVAFLFMMLTGWRCAGYLRTTMNFVLSRSMLLVVCMAAFAPLAAVLYTGNAPGSQDGQGSIRIALWINGLEAWAHAPYFGHGPGHYSGLEKPYSGMEAHNFFIDWISAYGVTGFIGLLLLFSYLFAHAFKKKIWIVCAFYIALIVQIIFHFYGRQPVFWLWWIFGLIISLSFRGHVLVSKSRHDNSTEEAQEGGADKCNGVYAENRLLARDIQQVP